MSNQPRARPWSRLPSVSLPQSSPAPEPTPAAAPAPALRPAPVPMPAESPKPQPSIIARPAFRPQVPLQEPTPTAPIPAVISPPQPPPPSPVVVRPPPPSQLQQPEEFIAPPPRAPPAIRVPSVRPRSTAPTASLPQNSTTMWQSPPSPEKEVPPSQVGLRIPPARKELSPNSASSPLELPPSPLRAKEFEQQSNVLFRKTFDKPKPEYDQPFKPSLTRNWKQDDSQVMGEKENVKSSANKLTDSEDALGVTIITIAGDNTGARMNLADPSKKHGFMGKPHFLFDKSSYARHNMITDNGTESESSSRSGKSKSTKEKSHRANKTKQSLPMSAYINSNVQGINNSIVCNSACSHHDPGVHLTLTKKPSDGGFVVKEKANVYQSD